MSMAAVALVTWLVTPAQARAQANTDPIIGAADCRLAEQVIRTGQPAPHMAWALRYIGACGAGTYGAATAAGVDRLRAVHDTVALGAVWRPTHFLLDEKLFRAALEIAGDRAASVEARVFAFLGLLRMALAGTNRFVEYQDLVGGFVDEPGAMVWVGGGCVQGTASHDSRLVGTPLPADFKHQIRLVASRVRNDEAEPVDVRTAALCTVSTVRAP
jgi:hypothetical protein